MNDKIKDIALLSINKNNASKVFREINDDTEEIRISIFFDYAEDNHHIQFSKYEDRRKIGQLLHDLAERVLIGT